MLISPKNNIIMCLKYKNTSLSIDISFRSKKMFKSLVIYNKQVTTYNGYLNIVSRIRGSKETSPGIGFQMAAPLTVFRDGAPNV